MASRKPAAKKSAKKSAPASAKKTTPKGSAAKRTAAKDEDDEDEDDDEDEETPTPKRRAKAAADDDDDEDSDDTDDTDDDEDDTDDDDTDDDEDEDETTTDDDEDEEEVAAAPVKTRGAGKAVTNFPASNDEQTALLREIRDLLTESTRMQSSVLQVLTAGARSVGAAAPAATAKATAAAAETEAEAPKKGGKKRWEPVTKASDLSVGDKVRVTFEGDDEPTECTVSAVGKKKVTITTVDEDGDEAEADINPAEEEVTVLRK